MKPIIIKDVNAIQSLSIPVPDRGGIVVLTGRNRIGKSTAIRCVNRLLGKDGDLSVRDGAIKGEVSGFGVRFTVGKKNVRRDGNSLLEVTGFDRSAHDELVDPGIADPVKADAARIKALVTLTGQEVNPSLFYSLVGGKEEFERLCPGLDIGESDLLRYAGLVKRELERHARESETARDTSEGAKTAAEAAIAGLNLDGETDEKVLRAALTEAVKVQSAVKSRLQAYTDSQENAKTAREAMAADAEKHVTVEAAELRLSTAEAEVNRLEMLLTTAKAERDAADLEHSAALSYQETLAVWKNSIDFAESASKPTEDEIHAADIAVDKANKAIETGALIRKGKEQRAAAIKHATDYVAHNAASIRLRKAAQGVDGVLSGLVAKVGCGLSVRENRLILQTDRGQVYYGSKEDVSDGQRWRVAIDIIVEAFRQVYGHEQLCVMTLEQSAWAELDPTARKSIHEHAQKLGVLIVTAEATGDEQLRAEEFGLGIDTPGSAMALESVGA